MTPAVVQIGAWCGAFWLAHAVHERRTPDSRARARFTLALCVGALAARAGNSLLWGDAGRMLLPGEPFSILFFPLGVLALAPHAAAFASLPAALALARLGCLPAGCCRGSAGELLPAFEAAGLATLHLLLGRGAPERAAERFAFGFGALRLVQAPWRPAIGGPATPELVALLWMGIGALLVARRRRLL